MPGSVKAEVKTYRNFINGEWVAGASGETFPVYDPSTEEIIAQVASSQCRGCGPRGKSGAGGV